MMPIKRNTWLWAKTSVALGAGLGLWVFAMGQVLALTAKHWRGDTPDFLIAMLCMTSVGLLLGILVAVVSIVVNWSIDYDKQ